MLASHQSSSVLAAPGYWLTRASARTLELFHIEFPVGDLAGDTHQLLLALQQAQAQSLLRVFDIPVDGFLFAVDLFDAQVAKGGHDGCQKQQNGCQWRQHGEAVLALGWSFRHQLPKRCHKVSSIGSTGELNIGMDIREV